MVLLIVLNFKKKKKNTNILICVTDCNSQGCRMAFAPHLQGNNFSEVTEKAFRKKEKLSSIAHVRHLCSHSL